MDVRPYHSGMIRHSWNSEVSFGAIRELEMIRRPTSVEELFRLFEEPEPLDPVVLWIDTRKDFFVYNSGVVVRPKDYSEYFHLNVSKNDICSKHLFICSKTLQGVCDCLDFLSELSMWVGCRMILYSWNYPSEQSCPFPCEVLKKFVVQNQKGMCEFNSMTFTPAQCETLATSGTKTHLIFSGCTFQDQGQAFADAFLSRENQDLGPAKLDLEFDMPLDEARLIACLSKLQELALESFDITEAFWTALLGQISHQPSLRKLEFHGIDIRGGSTVATRKERTKQFANAIVANNHIEHMEFCSALFNEKVWKSLVIPALEHNRVASIARVSNTNTRKAILAEALKKVNDRPSLGYDLLRQNLQVILDSDSVTQGIKANELITNSTCGEANCVHHITRRKQNKRKYSDV